MLDTLPQFSQNANPVVFLQSEQIAAMLRSIVREEITTKKQEDLQAQLLSPEETCKLFNPRISKVTLNEWTNKGYLTKYYLGGRTYYKFGEVIEAGKTLKKYNRNQC